MTNQEKLSVHDHFLLGYQVDAIKREIVLKTEFRDQSRSETMNVIFRDVEAYYFKYASFDTILNEIEETEPVQILNENWRYIEAGWQASGWPASWAVDINTANSYLSSQKLKGFKISSSIGMQGWVLAKSVLVTLD